ncbi:MAG: phosphoribosyltransferase [Verrucomicrobiaceae bacterium]|nr:MAG: phosphoribosyltransferase [Verrucomicrobiaceae bacterium]
MQPSSTARLERVADNAYRAHIPGGALNLWMERELIRLPEALDFATRHNPRRRFLFVSKLLGRHLPTRPKQMRDAAVALAAELKASALPEPCVFFGMAETATTLGQAVFREWHRGGGKGLYVDSTRRHTGEPLAFTFSEVHSHAQEHVVHLPTQEDDPEGLFGKARSIVIVDDEATTGRTAAQLLAAYEHWVGRPVAGHLAVLVHWRNADAEQLPLCVHSLLAGRFEFMPKGEFDGTIVTSPHATQHVQAPRGTRHGLASPQTSPWTDVPAGRVLVVGTGEYGFEPLLLAEQIEAAGGDAFLQATTRSPVAPGGAIGHVRRFPALSGEGYEEFLYNVPDDHAYDRVILCCEDRLPPPEHPLLALPRLECRLAR